MTIRYVSTMLADLICADDVVQIVRKQCFAILEDVPQETAARLKVPLHYISSKCMGFPAVWLVASALNLSDADLATRLEACPGPLYISLTTSIADDFIDGDENIGAAHMMLLYLFVFAALREPHWFDGTLLQTYRKRIYPLIGAFVGDHPLKMALSEAELHRSAEQSSWRIGNFFETIARSLTLQEDERIGDNLGKLCRSFGNWCSHLDDVVDVECDIASGDTFTYPIFVLCRHSDAIAAAVRERDVSGCRQALGSQWFLDALIAHHDAQLRELMREASDQGLTLLVDKLERILAKLPALIVAIRRENSAADNAAISPGHVVLPSRLGDKVNSFAVSPSWELQMLAEKAEPVIKR